MFCPTSPISCVPPLQSRVYQLSSLLFIKSQLEQSHLTALFTWKSRTWANRSHLSLAYIDFFLLCQWFKWLFLLLYKTKSLIRNQNNIQYMNKSLATSDIISIANTFSPTFFVSSVLGEWDCVTGFSRSISEKLNPSMFTWFSTPESNDHQA